MKEIIDSGAIFMAVTDEWGKWSNTKNEVKYFGFKEYISKTFGFEYDRASNGGVGFKYRIVDEQKFMLFLLRIHR